LAPWLPRAGLPLRVLAGGFGNPVSPCWGSAIAIPFAGQPERTAVQPHVFAGPTSACPDAPSHLGFCWTAGTLIRKRLRRYLLRARIRGFGSGWSGSVGLSVGNKQRHTGRLHWGSPPLNVSHCPHTRRRMSGCAKRTPGVSGHSGITRRSGSYLAALARLSSRARTSGEYRAN
jgi:hypothetical protein